MDGNTTYIYILFATNVNKVLTPALTLLPTIVNDVQILHLHFGKSEQNYANVRFTYHLLIINYLCKSKISSSDVSQ